MACLGQRIESGVKPEYERRRIRSKNATSATENSEERLSSSLILSRRMFVDHEPRQETSRRSHSPFLNSQFRWTDEERHVEMVRFPPIHAAGRE